MNDSMIVLMMFLIPCVLMLCFSIIGILQSNMVHCTLTTCMCVCVLVDYLMYDLFH